MVTTGTVTAELCPRGTMRNQTGGQSELDCWPCDGGHYCDVDGGLGPSGECQERYYCPDVANISSATPSAYLCPPGFYCPQSTADPVPCPPGRRGGRWDECSLGWMCWGFSFTVLVTMAMVTSFFDSCVWVRKAESGLLGNKNMNQMKTSKTRTVDYCWQVSISGHLCVAVSTFCFSFWLVAVTSTFLTCFSHWQSAAMLEVHIKITV